MTVEAFFLLATFLTVIHTPRCIAKVGWGEERWLGCNKTRRLQLIYFKTVIRSETLYEDGRLPGQPFWLGLHKA